MKNTDDFRYEGKPPHTTDTKGSHHTLPIQREAITLCRQIDTIDRLVQITLHQKVQVLIPK